MIYRLASLIAVLLIWWGITAWSAIPSFLLPTPYDVGLCFVTFGPTIAFHTAFSLGEITAGLLISLGVGLLLLPIFAQRSEWRASTLHFLTALQAIPIFALLPLLILWLGHGVLTKILVISLSCFFPIMIGGLQGLSRISPHYYDVSLLFRARSLAQFWHIELPAILPYLMTGFRLAAVHAPITVIAADWIGATQGLGYMIMLASGRLQVDLLFSCIICLIGLSLSLNKGCNVLFQKLIYWPNDS